MSQSRKKKRSTFPVCVLFPSPAPPAGGGGKKKKGEGGAESQNLTKKRRKGERKKQKSEERGSRQLGSRDFPLPCTSERGPRTTTPLATSTNHFHQNITRRWLAYQGRTGVTMWSQKTRTLGPSRTASKKPLHRAPHPWLKTPSVCTSWTIRFASGVRPLAKCVLKLRSSS